MWSRLYRNHVIMAFPTYDTVANAWGTASRYQLVRGVFS